VMEVPIDEATRFGTLIVDSEGRAVQFEEKPEQPRSNLVSMGIYVFNKSILFERLEEDAESPTSAHDFGRNIIPTMVERDRVYAYPFQGYWRDVGTLQSYWETNMDLLKELPEFDLYDREFTFHTKPVEQPPAKLGTDAIVRRSLIGDGCIVEGEVYNSVLSPCVRVCRGAIVQDSIVMNGATIEDVATVDHAILDKNVVVGRGAVVGFGDDFAPNRQQPRTLSSGLTVIGKNSQVAPGTRIGRNVILGSDLLPEDFPGGVVRSGETIPSRRRRWWMETAARS
jgi:glucose-1-phosphate adenylyltransferase